jgi:hypothetical protein
MVLLTSLSALLILVFFGVLAFALVRISAVLRSIGGTPTSFLAKLRLGLRAIERETSHLTPQVLKINAGLTAIGGGLASVDQHLFGTIDAVVKQEPST